MFKELDQLLRSDVFDTIPKEEVLELQDGERREVSILFADIQDFSALSEQLDPEQVRVIVDKLLQLFTLCIEQYGGYIDKYEGDLVMALFGAKVASERDTERAIRAALEMLKKFKQFNTILANNPEVKGIELGVRIGINTGLVTTGRVGAKRAGDFTVYGDAVNLASQMESNAPVNRIMLPQKTMQIVKRTFEFEDHGTIPIKGRSKPVSVFLVKRLKAKPTQRWHIKQSAYVGRDRELTVLHKKYDMVLQRLKKIETPGVCQTPGVSEEKPIVLGIKGQAGFGKSRLVYEFLTSIHEARCILYGTTPRVAQNPYCVFTSMIKYYFDISQIDSPQIVKEKLETGIQELEASLNNEVEVQNLHGILPMVGFLLGVKYDDIRLQLKGKELQPHLQTAIRYFLEAVAAKANRIGVPLLVIWEDLQWLDEVSRATLDVLMQTLNLEEKRKQQDFKHFVFVFTYRPEYKVPEAVKSESDFSEIELMPLDEYNAEALIQSMVGEITLPTIVKQQVMEKSEGNPFYLEEWANLVSEMPSFDNGRKTLPVPSSLTALVLSRIDRLEHDLKLLLQKAAVIGKEFFVKILEEIEKKLNRPEDISEQLTSLETGDFIRRTFGSKYSAYFFKHLITHEVAYNTLLIANRKILHRITAEVIEEQFTENIEEFYYELAEHYSKAEILDKTIEYLEKAGDKAKANYDNEKAVEFYDRLLLNLKGFENLSGLRIDILLKKGEVLQIIGKWNDCKHAYAEALRGAGKIDDSRRMGESHWALSVILRLQGSYEGAMAHCERSLALFQTIDDQMGVSKAVGNMGNVHLLKSDYEAAMACYEKSLTIKEALGDKAGISYDIGNMGGVYYDTGNYEAAVACYEKKFRICGELGDKLGISRALGYMGNVYYSKGDYEFAIVYYEKDLELCEELGDKLGISKAVGNMGNVYYNQGDYETAMACYERSLKICKELGYKMGISASAGIMGFVHRDQGNYETAMIYFEKVLTIQEELGDKRGLSASFGNMGVIYHNKGDYDAAVTCFEKALRIREKLEYKKGISLAVNHMGIIYKDKGDYETAIAYYDRAIKIGRALGINPFLCGYLMNKAEVLYLQQRFDEARVLSVEGLQIAGEVGRKETVFQGKVLLARIDFALGHQEKTVTLLVKMLTQTENKVEQADLHYELYQCGVEREEHRKEALRLYQELYTKTPKFEWKKRIEELEITSLRIY